jgi:hypothetical protein
MRPFSRQLYGIRVTATPIYVIGNVGRSLFGGLGDRLKDKVERSERLEIRNKSQESRAKI